LQRRDAGRGQSKALRLLENHKDGGNQPREAGQRVPPQLFLRMENPENTTGVTISWMVFNCAVVNSYKP
jgi:hypothetical protein